MPDSHDDIETRVTILEREVVRLREQVALSGSDAAAARVLASGADHDVSEPTLGTGMAQITALLTGMAGSGPD